MFGGIGNLDDSEKLICNKSKDKTEMPLHHQKWYLQMPWGLRELVLLESKSEEDTCGGMAGHCWATELGFYAIGDRNHGKIPCHWLSGRFFWERSQTEERTGWDLSEHENGLNVIEKGDGESIVLYSDKKWWVRAWTNVGKGWSEMSRITPRNKYIIMADIYWLLFCILLYTYPPF